MHYLKYLSSKLIFFIQDVGDALFETVSVINPYYHHINITSHAVNCRRVSFNLELIL